MDVSSEMIHSLLPLFMVTTLGLGTFTIGIIEALADSTALIVKVFSGALSDHLGRRKALAVIGYPLGAATKPGEPPPLRARPARAGDGFAAVRRRWLARGDAGVTVGGGQRRGRNPSDSSERFRPLAWRGVRDSNPWPPA